MRQDINVIQRSETFLKQFERDVLNLSPKEIVALFSRMEALTAATSKPWEKPVTLHFSGQISWLSVCLLK
jgi:hypothetical protein